MSVDFDVVDALAGLAEDLRGEGDFVARIHDAVEKLKKERDEARAEVEREKASATRGWQTADELHLKVRDLKVEVARLREGEECHVARPGEGTYECNANDPCPACELRITRAEVERLQDLFQRTHGVHHTWVDSRDKVAEDQRAKCLKAFSEWLREVHATGLPHETPEMLADAVDAGELSVSLVTEGKP